MGKTVKEKADEWHLNESTVRKYCLSGIIPPAEKLGKPAKWQIPDQWPRPPLTRHSLCYLLDTIYQLNHGAVFDSLNMGFSSETLVEGYKYLISSGFMSEIDVYNLSDTLKEAIVTPRGKMLIERENADSERKVQFKAHMTAKASIGIASFEVGGEISNK